jgi:predicted SnoaL-like aldol condensation-catalyzing enzyme
MDFYRADFAQHPQQSVRIARSAVENDTVFLHLHRKSSPDDRGRAVVDIYRVEEGKIVEHWSVEQPEAEAEAGSGDS